VNFTDPELIASARKHVPSYMREERYSQRDPKQLRDDLNLNFDLTRALLRQIDELQSQLLQKHIEKWLLAGILGGAAAKGLEVGIVALFKLLVVR
jgi:hypothetical protein